MRAAWHESTGGTDVLKVGELDDPPAPDRDEVRIRVEATSLDRVDLYWREGSHGMRLRWPQHVGGRDLAGTIDAVGADVAGLSVGQRVISSGERTHAELALAPAALTLPLPDHVDIAAAGATPTSGRSAWAGLMDKARIQPGETVLVMAAGSGVGSFGIQIAAAAGCTVITSAGTEAKRRQAIGLGAVAAVDHRADDLADQVRDATDGRGVDVVLDHIGEPVFPALMRSLAPEGRFVTCGVTAGHRTNLHLGALFTQGHQLMGVGRPDDATIRGHLTDLLEAIGRGDVTPQIAAEYALDDIAKAHDTLAGPDCFGKVVLRP